MERLGHITANDKRCHCVKCVAAAEIKRLTDERNEWQATAAGLSQDISNAEDEIERLRAVIDGVDAVRQPVEAKNTMLYCNECGVAWPCVTASLLHPEEACRERPCR